MSPPDFGKSVNPISTKGGRLCQPNNTGTSGFSGLPTALETEYLVSKLYIAFLVNLNFTYLPKNLTSYENDPLVNYTVTAAQSKNSMT